MSALLRSRPLRGLNGDELTRSKQPKERADAIYHLEPLVFMAERGYLTDDEIADLRQAADEARPRIGTGHERIGSGGVDRADRRRVLIWEAVEAALERGSTRPR